ncbi:MAG TPA: hypothetical protein VF622_18755 [Segetibacter sp.]|jgi:hypothetical protein
MKFASIVEEYFETRQELQKGIENFEQQRHLSLFKKLVTDQDEMNFFSWLAEVRFGLFFNRMCNDIYYDQTIDTKTPDWTLLLNGQKILGEVLRVNTPESEYRESIAQNRKQRSFQKENPGVPFITHGPIKVITLEHLAGAESKLVRKEEKYRNIILKYHLPFILCVAPTIDTFLFELDFQDFLMGGRGFFRRNENFGQHVTGVLLNTPFGGFFYYHNERAKYPLTVDNLQKFQPLFYHY